VGRAGTVGDAEGTAEAAAPGASERVVVKQAFLLKL
jgi:hypothetical protein